MVFFLQVWYNNTAFAKRDSALLYKADKKKVTGMAKETGIRLIAQNKKAYHDYFIDDKWEAGIELFGTEVKSIRMGKCSIKEAFVKIDRGEVYVYGMHISPYEKGNIFNKDPLRVRKLLLHKCEIMKLNGKIAEKGYTLMPLQVYFNRKPPQAQDFCYNFPGFSISVPQST